MIRKNIGSFIFLFLLMILTGYAILKNNDIHAVVRAIQNVDVLYLMLGMCLGLLYVSGEGVIIWYLLKSMQLPVKIFQCIKYSFIGYFFSGITPSSSGGQPVQVYYMKKDGIKLGDSTVVLMAVAILFKFVLVLVGAGVLFVKGSEIIASFGSYMWLYYLGLFLHIVLVVVLTGFMVSPRYSGKIVFAIEGFIIKLRILKPSESRREKLTSIIADYQTAVQYFKNNKRKIVTATLLTFLQRCCTFLLTYMIFTGFGQKEANLFTIMALQAAINIAADMLPLPGAVGITELLYTVAFSSIFTGELLTAAMLVTRGINFYFLMIVSFFITIYSHLRLLRVRKLTERA